jgi:hypothetical protein
LVVDTIVVHTFRVFTQRLFILPNYIRLNYVSELKMEEADGDMFGRRNEAYRGLQFDYRRP